MKKGGSDVKEDTSKKEDGNKTKAIDMAVTQIEKLFGKGSIMKLGEKPIEAVAVVSTGSIALDIALGVGGLPRGRVIEIYGPEASGKTTLALQVVALRLLGAEADGELGHLAQLLLLEFDARLAPVDGAGHREGDGDDVVIAVMSIATEQEKRLMLEYMSAVT